MWQSKQRLGNKRFGVSQAILDTKLQLMARADFALY